MEERRDHSKIRNENIDIRQKSEKQKRTADQISEEAGSAIGKKMNGKERKQAETSEREMLGKIWESSQSVSIPDALEPEQIKKHISDRHSRKIKFYKAAAAAACLCLCFGGGSLALKYSNAGAESSRLEAESYQNNGGQSDLHKEGSDLADKTVTAADDSVPDSQDEAAQDEAESINAADIAEEPPLKKIGMYRLASNYKDVYDVVEKANRLMRYNDAVKKEAMLPEGTAEEIRDINASIENGAMEDSGQASGDNLSAGSLSFEQDISFEEDKSDFSTTNLQVAGVDESDIVKTDGRYIYVVKNDRIQVLDVQNKIPEKAGQIIPDLKEDTDRICEMYIADQVLTLIIQSEEMQLEDGRDVVKDSGKKEPAGGSLSDEAEDMAACKDVLSLHVSSVTKVMTYDITDPKKAVLLSTAVQDGGYQTSRKIGSCLYLFTNKSLYVTDDMRREDAVIDKAAGGWLPCVNGQTVKADCIYLPKEGNGGLIMSSIDLSDNNKVLDTKLIINNNPEVYVTSRSVYLYETDYLNDIPKTRIVRFELDHGIIRAKAAAAVKGCIEDTFAIHENGNYLQVLTSVTSTQPWENRVYVLDQNLEKVGKLTGLAEDEMIYAARFVGTMGYFVTYRNTDPLFTVDFSNPGEPKIVGELKVTGFSEYLHFWDDEHLLGIGYETDPESGRNIGIKMSMFNIADPAKVTEEAKVVLKDVDSCEAMYNYKCVLVSVQKNVIAFTTQDYDNEYKEDYFVFSYKDGRFVSRLEYPLSRKNVYDGNGWRSVYAKDVLYLVNEKKTIAFDMKDQWKEIGKVKY